MLIVSVAVMSWNSRPLPSLSLPRFYPSPAASNPNSKQVQPNTPSLSSLIYPPTHRSRSSAPQPYITSPTCTSPSQSRAPYNAYDDIPPLIQPQSHREPHSLPRNAILIQQPNGPPILVTLPPQPHQPSRPSSHSYFRAQQLLQAVAPLSPSSVSYLRPASAASSSSSQPFSSSHTQHSYYAEASVLTSHVSTASQYCEPSVAVSERAVSRRTSLNASLHAFAEAPSAPSPTPPLADSGSAAPSSSAVAPPSAMVAFPTGFSSSSWSMFFLSLPASPIFLHYLSVCLVSMHAALLFVSILLFLLTLLRSLSPLSEPLCFYLLFYAAKSIAALAMCAYRLSHPECWQVDELSDSRRSARRYHIMRHILRCVSVASTGVVTWWLFSADDSWADGAAVSRFVLALLCVEYASIVAPLLSNLLLSFFVPCIHLSFYLPYLPFPAFQPPSADTVEDKPGMSEEDLTHLPSTVYRPSPIPRDTTCAVCLCEVEEGEEIRQLTCRHMYHRACIDSWLRKRGVCPLCVRKVSVKPANKRLAEPVDAAAVRSGGGIEMTVATSTSHDDVTLNVSTIEVAAGVGLPLQQYDVDLHPDRLEA